MSNIDKLNQLAGGRKSSWLSEATERQKNASWMSKSAEVAFALLRELRHQGMSQRELAEKMGVSAQYVSKIVKGKENLSLETICKIEDALGVSLVNINNPVHMSFVVQRAVDMPVAMTATGCRVSYNVNYSDKNSWLKEGAA